MIEKFYLTKKGLEKIKEEYQNLKKIKLAKTEGEPPEALHSEDLNPEYVSFREDLNFLETKISEFEHIFKNIEIIKKPPKKKRETICLGATVTLKKDSGGKDEFTIVGTLEASPSQGKISSYSPVGRVLLGHKLGDKINIATPIKLTYKVEKIQYHLL
jgi:transcription elongation factor GreA